MTRLLNHYDIKHKGKIRPFTLIDRKPESLSQALMSFGDDSEWE